MPSLRHIDVTINHTTKLHIRAFKTFKLDLQPFQHIFKAELMKKGVKFVEKKLTATSLYELH